MFSYNHRPLEAQMSRTSFFLLFGEDSFISYLFSQRPGTVDSVMSERSLTRATSNTLILPR